MYNKLLIVTITGTIILGIYYNFYLKKVNNKNNTELEDKSIDKTVINKLDNYSSSESESESEFLETFSNESNDNEIINSDESINSDDMYEDWKNLLLEHIDDKIIDTKYLPNNLNDDTLVKNYKPINDKKNHQKRFWILN